MKVVEARHLRPGDIVMFGLGTPALYIANTPSEYPPRGCLHGRNLLSIHGSKRVFTAHGVPADCLYNVVARVEKR